MFEWTGFWVVAGGNTSRTLDVAREWEARDPRIRVIEEPTRRGKSAALAEICAVAQGDLLVLLNGDARARPGAVSAMIEAARDAEAPFGVMARPVIDGDRPARSVARSPCSGSSITPFTRSWPTGGISTISLTS